MLQKAHLRSSESSWDLDKVIINKDLMVAATAKRQRCMMSLEDGQQTKKEKTKSERRKLTEDEKEKEELKRKKQTNKS